MGVLGGSGGDDRLQVQLAVFGIVISLMVTALLPVLIPTGNAAGYTLEEIYAERNSLELYTGESMINQSPFKLVHVYLPYTLGDAEYHLTEEGWLYGSELKNEEEEPSYVINGVEQIGKTEVRLDPAYKSSVPLYQSPTAYLEYKKISMWDDLLGGGFWSELANGIFEWISLPGAHIEFADDLSYERPSTAYYPTWNYSGYRYEFDPMLRIQTNTDGEPSVNMKTVDDAKLSIVWYDTDGQEGISGGLVLYNQRTNAILASYTAAEIVANYDPLSQTASKFYLDFDGTRIWMWIKFDPDVLINNLDLSQSFTLGRWTVAFTTASADTFLDLQNSQSFTSSLGGMLETYIGIFTQNLPQLDPIWNLVLWVVCVMPMSLAVILFLSRFGLAGIGAGILGTLLIAGGGLIG